jgi:hypothetical protein
VLEVRADLAFGHALDAAFARGRFISVTLAAVNLKPAAAKAA